MAIEGTQDVVTAISRAKRVFSRWLDIPDLNGLLRVMSELCANVHQHSGDLLRCVMIPKYEEIARQRIVVSVAVGDLGLGVRASLAARHSEIGREPLDYLHEALGGRTSQGLAAAYISNQAAEKPSSIDWLHSWRRMEMSPGPLPKLFSCLGTVTPGLEAVRSSYHNKRTLSP